MKLGLKAAAAVFATSAILAAASASAASAAERSPPASFIEASVVSGMMNTTSGSLFLEIRRLYPKEWERLRTEVLAALERNPANAEAEGERIGAAFLDRFMSDHLSSAAKAPTPDLMMVAASGAALARKLKAENAKACAAFVWGGDPSSLTNLSPEAEAMLANYERTLVTASASGERTPARHAQIDEAAQTALIQALSYFGVDEAVAKVMDAGGKADTPEQSCAAGAMMMEAMAAVEPELQAVFQATFLIGAGG